MSTKRKPLMQLKPELAFVIRTKILQTDFENATLTTKRSASNTAKCTFLDKLPSEIRLHIYELLLVNPIVGTRNSVGYYSSLEPSPNILGACRQIYNEAAPVLYGKNTFFIQCSRETLEFDKERCGCEVKQCQSCNESRPCQYYADFWNSYNHVPFEPSLTRYWDNTEDRNWFMTLDKVPSFNLVQHWKVVISPLDVFPHGIRCKWSLSPLCCAIAQASPKSIEIAIVSLRRRLSWGLQNRIFEECLEPLRALRKVGSISFTVAQEKDLIFVSQGEIRDNDPNYTPKASLLEELRGLVTSDCEREFLRPMYERLLRYAQSYERFQPFRLMMELSSRHTRIADEFGSEFDKYHLIAEQTPYPYKEHPVELGLFDAKATILKNDGAHFRFFRNTVLEYLEHQHEKIMLTRENIIHFIKKGKVASGIFDLALAQRDSKLATSDIPEYETNQGLLLLEDYAEAFIRELPFDNRAIFNRHKAKLKKVYHSREREELISQLYGAADDGNLPDFMILFKSAFDDLEKQYMEIQTARQLLFTADIFRDRGLEEGLDIEEFTCEDGIDWAIDTSVLPFYATIPNSSGSFECGGL
ncbi:uncharacterized protein LY89DRAFT_675538 [Mollisia scopiformis]|uniref:F-box domain-containing protein n=1 Tax=Mollisia scopiformis TaxID=149040 RepID=A0A132BC87_MOLSC|nr:uncharacterized protein LY89DRAFT_675538 [Mollisia scopiformis]KUJ10040.1 hypothetical protein LY89DRAFT_675538 [Mollisia scopiformis]